MSKVVVEPPESSLSADGSLLGGWWRETGQEDRIVCDLCPRECNMKPGDRGFCFVRQNIDGEMRLTTYGRSTGFCIDPIEKKPLNHFLPGTAVLSFGTAGCNLGCKFCQNWDISKSREVERLSELALPDMIAAAAVETGCRSVAYTYNDPIIWAEYAIDTAKACRDQGVKSVAVTAGYISEAARAPFFHAMDAANVDLKAFTDDFYEKITYSQLQPVLDTLRWLKHESDVWFEITNLLIPKANDSPDELRRMCDWLLDACGDDVPIHFTAFHPDFRMTDRGRTPHETLLAAREIARTAGVKFAYVGNVHDVQNQSTWCPRCNELLIERDWHQLGRYTLSGNRCQACGEGIPGVFEAAPGTWGRKRQPIRIGNYAERPKHETMESMPVELHVPPATQEENRRKEVVTMQSVSQSPTLTAEQESAIHKSASEIVVCTVNRRPVQLSDPTMLDAASTTVMGAFVTLKRNGHLRGCCGSLGQPMSVIEALRQSAVRTATDDHRFPPVSPTELPYLKLDVTLLFNFEPVQAQGDARAKEIEIGKHGLRIARGNQAGLLLPVVAIENNWDAETFLDQVCRKAQLPVSAWRENDTQLLRFEGRMIERDLDKDLVESIPPTKRLANSQREVDALAIFAQNNIYAHLQGAIPGTFPPNCSDGTVDGVTLQLSFSANPDQSVTFSQLQFRGGMPLQTTLLKLTEAAAGWLRNSQVTMQSMKVDLVLFADPAMHGPVASADLNGFDPRHRAVLVREGTRTAWKFNRGQSAEELLGAAVELCQVTTPDAAHVMSFEAISSAASIGYSNAPKPESGTEVRRAALAGKFYPSAPGALAAIVKKCLGEIPEAKTTVPAVMVPHAGLQYSGSIAADVLKRIDIPETVIVIGPKHTRQGVDWAVAPHTIWQLPDGEVESDVELAKKLADRIDGLELDAAAHANEHSIEVELPFLARLAPNTRVVGIAMGGGGDFERFQKFGRQLAEVIGEMNTRPLLIISSDMNHFSTDDENRRLDELALSAMESLDPETLLNTVREKNISMCGVVPAVVVMEALKANGQLTELTRVGYGTSGDVTGDLHRVVGYAGVLLG